MSEITQFPATIEASQVETGMTIRVHQKIKDVNTKGEEKERVQVFEGLVLKIGGTGISKTMTIRKVSGGIGVERIYPIASPVIAKIEIVKKIKTRRKDIGFVRGSKKRLREEKVVKLRAVKKQEAPKAEAPKQEAEAPAPEVAEANA
jgi:large subunit ribosomal protein L19